MYNDMQFLATQTINIL